jgi:TonB family protein
MLIYAPMPQPPGGRLRRALSLLASVTIHGSVLGWVALGPAPRQAPKTLYEQVIQPNREKIVWHSLKSKLPDVTPASKSKDKRPPRAVKKMDQTMVANSGAKTKSEQMIWLPKPSIETPKELPSPNVLAVQPRPFTPPSPKSITAPTPVLPDAPEMHVAAATTAPPVEAQVARPQPRPFTPPPPKPVTRPSTLPDAPELRASAVPTASPVETPVARPKPRAFTPPPSPPRDAKPATLLTAPHMTAAMNLKDAPLLPPKITLVKPAPKTFIPPTVAARGPNAAPPSLPTAPDIAASISQASPSGLPQPARPAPRAFVPPSAGARGGAASLPNAPELAGTIAGAAPAGLPQPARPTPRAFVPPASAGAGVTPGLPAAPELAAANTTPSAAIVGLKPSATPEVPLPDGARSADFAAGPVPRPEGGTGGNEGAMINIPGLLIRGGAREAQPTLMARVLEPPTSANNLMSAARLAPRPVEEAGPPRGNALRVSSSPDPRMDGRIIYMIAVQMPNITSYSGSWIMWFAEHERVPGQALDLRPPLPLHKVDPKYIVTATEEGVQGKVRLQAVIRRTGLVEAVAVLQGLDPRLDHSAEEAMSKWEFEPALRNGVPVDIDAVVEIPFRLPPRGGK